LKLAYTVEHTHRNVATVRMGGIYSGWEQWFLLSSDRHHDNPECDQKLERSTSTKRKSARPA
jgi:hypothetical protein